MSRCVGCNASYFPSRLICHRCGGSAWESERCYEGVVEETTTVNHAIGQDNWSPRKIASVRLADGQLIVAGLSLDTESGAQVALFEEDGAPRGNLKA